MNKNPKISIITITFNSGKTLENTILSVLNQSYPSLEYLIIDGGSTDNTLNIIEKYKDRIDEVVSEKDEGISDAFNKGINLATGEIIGIINSDDLLLPDAILTLAQNYDPKVEVYRGNIIIWNSETNLKKREIPSMKFPIWNFLPNVSHPGTFIAKSAYMKFGCYDKNFKYLMDLNLLTQLYRKGAIFRHMNFDIALFRLDGITSASIRKKKYELKRYIYANGGFYAHFVMYYYPRLLLGELKRLRKLVVSKHLTVSM